MICTLSSSARPAPNEVSSALSSLSVDAADIIGEVVGVGADVADRAAGARALGIDAPFRLLVAGLLGRLGQPVLRIFDLDQPDLAEIARLAPFRAPAAPADSRCSCASPRRCRPDLSAAAFSFFASASESRQRLVADHMNAGLQEGVGRPGMHVVGRDDRHRLDAVRRAWPRPSPSPRNRHRCGRPARPSASPERRAFSGVDDRAPATSS